MPRFRRENGKVVPKKKFATLRIEEDIAEEFRKIAEQYGMTHTQLLDAMMKGNRINGKNVAPLVTHFGKLLEDFNNGTGVFGGKL